MKLVVVGATGGVGREILAHARSAGHELTAIVRNPKGLPDDVAYAQVDFTNASPETVRPALAGAAAVLSALGPRSRADAGITASAARLLCAAMCEADVRRVIAVSAAPVGTIPSAARPDPPKRDEGDGLVIGRVLTPVVKRVFGWSYRDLAEMEGVLLQSGLDWTVVRPPRLVNKPLTGSYRTAVGHNVPRGMKIGRADLAHLMLSLLDDPRSVRKTVGVAY